MKWMVIIIVAFSAVLLLSCASKAQSATAAESKELVARGAVLLDVRTREEFESGHLDGAKLVPVQELEARWAEVGPVDKPVVVYCRSGRRSQNAAQILKAHGFTQVHDLGAMSNWPK